MFVGRGEPLVVEQITPTAPGPNDVVVQLGASGVCHSDLSLKNGFVPVRAGVVFGHEGAGTVVGVGANVSLVRVGDTVIASGVPACGLCPSCISERSQFCETEFETMTVPRGTRRDGTPYLAMAGLGTFAQEMTVNQNSVVKVVSNLPFDQLALIGCGVTTGIGAALNTAAVHPGASVAIIGCGGVGLSVLQGARIAGAARIIAIDIGEEKRGACSAQGATDYIDASLGDPVAQVHGLTAGLGVDYAFEVIGLPATTLQAYNMTRKGGMAVLVGMTRIDAEVTLSTFDLFYNEKTIKGCKLGSAQIRRDFQRFVDLAEAGQLDLASMISRKIRLEDINDAFSAMENKAVTRSVITSF